jgi:hypothetical protein
MEHENGKIQFDINHSKVDEIDSKALVAELNRIRQVIAHPADYDCGFYDMYEFLAEHFGWKKMSGEKLNVYHELTRSIPLEAVSADILDSISFNREELDNYWYAYGFIDYPLGFLILEAEGGDEEATAKVNLWREFYTKNPEDLEKSIKFWERDENRAPDMANPVRLLYEIKFSVKETRDKELNRVMAVIARPMDYIATDTQFYLVYEFLAQRYGWKQMSTEKLIMYHELTRFGIPLEWVEPDILESIPFDEEELAYYREAWNFFDYPLNWLIENKSEAEASEKLILWRGFFEKNPEEFVKELKNEEDVIREHPDYQPCLQAWFDSEN